MPGAFPRATQGIPLAERSGPDNKLKRGLRGSEPVLIAIPLFSLFLSVKHCVRPPIGGSIKRAGERNQCRSNSPSRSFSTRVFHSQEKQASGVVFASVGKRRNGRCDGGPCQGCYYSATFPSLLYPVPMEDDSYKRVEPSDKAEITALESCISLYTGVYILFYFI